MESAMLRQWATYSVIFLSLLLLYGCGQKQVEMAEDAAEVDANKPFPLPATYSGKIACPDCEYVQVDLTLRPDQLYQLRKTWYSDGSATKSEAQMRRWKYEPKEKLIILGKTRGSLKTYAVKDADTLQFLDLEGTQTSALIDYNLRRTERVDLFPDVVKIRGMYRSSGNTHVLQECSSGLDFPVDPSGQFTELDRAYRTTPHENNEPLLVSFQGKLLPTRTGRQQRDKDIVVVTSFNRLYPDQDCAGKRVRNNIFGIHWTAAEIAGKPVTVDQQHKAPFFLLEAKGSRVKGFAGCNRFFGTFLFKGQVFIFNKLAATRMACRQNVSVENAFFTALDRTESYRLENGRLILLDKNDDVTMQLRAVE